MKKKLNILVVFGTRPEVIKLAPVIKEFRKHKNYFNCKVCVTGQHRQMLDPLLKLFSVKVDYDLNIMKANQGLEHITTAVLNEIAQILDQEKIDYLVVQGDTTTAMAAGLAAFYKKVKVVHVEAGLRTNNKLHPFPEEVNRRIIDSFADIYFAHTPWAKQNLVREGVALNQIEVTGNTVIDALLESAGKKYNLNGLFDKKVLADNRKLVLVTAHRRENFGLPIRNVCEAIKKIACDLKDDVYFIYPVHLNPNIQKPVCSILSGIENVILTKPLEYLPFVHLMKRAYLVLTDSGGLQEEAPTLGKPVLVLRETTERPEGVQAGCVKIVGTEKDKIVRSVKELLTNSNKYRSMSKIKNPYGDGQASQRIVKSILKRVR